MTSRGGEKPFTNLSVCRCRYNMGGDGGNDTQEVTTNTNRVESFLLRDGTYDWNRDHAGVTFLQMAQKYAVPYITFFINAAPSHIATNGAAWVQHFSTNATCADNGD